MSDDMKGGRYALLILAAVCLTYFTENFLRSAPSALTPLLIEELDISYGVAGILISSYFFLYALMQVPSGILSEALGPRRTIIYFTAFTVAGTALFYLARRLEVLVAALLLIGLGSSVFYINAVKIVSNWFPADKRASAIGVLSASSGLGNFASYMGFPLAAAYLGGWRPLFLYCCFIMVVNLAANFFILRNSPDGDGIVKASERKPIWASVKGALKDRRIYPFLVGYVFMSFNWVFFSWLPKLLMDTRGLSYIEVGIVSSAGTIMGIPGCIIIGIISDRLRRRKLPLVAFSTASTILLGVFLLLPAGSTAITYAVLFGGLGFTLSLWILFFSMIPESLPPETASIGLGIVNGMGTLGFSLMSPIYGALIDATGSYTASNLVIMACGIMMTVTFALFTRETYGQSG
ncbi:MAG TPA: MFS transporter [Patescibacteria group bacterium]|nr:MFS transporter [Patescibacteria group bacterium]